MHEAGPPIAQVARELGIHEGALANWVARERQRHAGADGGRLNESAREKLMRLRRENAEIAMERDVLERSAVLWVKQATR